MALSQALSTGITGLMSHQKAMDNIGNNLANVNTVGFKKGVYQFTTILEQAMRGGMMADAGTGRGSVNPISMGLGTATGSINKVFTQGPIENTGNPYDMAIDGNGFFVLKVGTGYAYTRAGSFYRGEDGSLLAGDGLYVQGTMAVKNADGSFSVPQDAKLQNIVIPIGVTGGHSQTTEAAFTGNLDSRQVISTGTRLFGSQSYPTVNNLQQWMWPKDWNGGDTDTKNQSDETWTSLQGVTYAVSRSTLANYGQSGVTLPSSINVYDDSKITTFPSASTATANTACVAVAYDVNNNRTVAIRDLIIEYNTTTPPPGTPLPVTDYVDVASPAWTALSSVWAADPALGGPLVPLVEEVKVINGGNVQTSAAYGIEVPEYLTMGKSYTFDGKSYTIQNEYTLPPWFYQSTGSAMSFAEISQMPSGCFASVSSSPPPAPNIDSTMRAIWPRGINGEGWPTSATLSEYDMPRKGETYAASLNTPLEHLRYLKGNVWVQPFKNIKNGDSIDISFKKGDSQVAATFVYNKPTGPDPFNGQVSVDREQSYTLEHFLKFLGGDVNEPTVACQNITPAMFGAPVTADYPDGDYHSQNWNRDGYEEALRNVALAQDEGNWDEIGGAMGLLSIPPRISDANYGDDAYDAPPESAGAFTRDGLQTINYMRYDPSTGELVAAKGASFNTSFVSNLGSQNALSDIKITYNNVPHESMYSSEKELNAPQGGSAMMTVDFYDSLGNPKSATVRLAMVSKTDDFTTWRWYADCPDDTDFPWQTDPDTGEITSNLNVGTGLIRFDKNGNFIKGAEYSESGGITINQSMQGVNNPIVIALINGLSSNTAQALDMRELTCTADSNSVKLKSQNGRPPGTLDDFTVTSDGVIQGIYSNGNVVNIARIGLAIIPNENGLIAAGNNLFYAGPASGDARYGHALTGGNGSIRHMQLESSNVDLSEEFTKLISTERGFQANSRTITTADEMITELLNLKR